MDNISNIQIVRKNNTLFLILGYISAVVSLVRFPFIFGVLGVVMGILSTRNGSRTGLFLIMASIVLMAAGLFFNDKIYNLIIHLLGF